MKSFLRRCLALVLVLAMSISGGIEAFAASDVLDTIVLDTENAVEATTDGNFKTIEEIINDAEKDFSKVENAENVTFIVELEGEPVLEAKSDSQTAAEYMTSFAGNKTLNSIEDEQETVKDRIKFDGNYDLKVEFTYNVVMNGLAVSGPYAAKEYLESLPGVKGVYVANTYDVPEISNEANYASITSGVMINSDISNDNGYTGKGTVTAVLDTGLDINHGAFANAPENPAFDLSYVEAAVASGYLLAGSVAVAEDLYVSEKVPFAFNYADGVADVTDNEQHGTHVSGTIGANCDDFKGVAPDTQIVMMKVFGDTQGASDAVIFAALQDAVILGVDAINMSLGTPGGFTYENEITEYYYGAVKAAGINLMCSAGNENNSVEVPAQLIEGLSSLYYYNYGLYFASNPDTAIVGSPSTYDAALSIASVNEYQDFISYVLAGDREISFNDANMETALDFVKFFDGQTLEYVVIPGYGAPEDYEGLDVEGKLALVMRGELDFIAKEANAAAAGAVGMIVYNNQPGDRIYMANEGLIPEIFISMEDGQYLIEQENKTISVSVDYNDFANTSDGGLMSSFSSIGPAPDLSIKPEITAPGGYVYSTLPGGGFGSMSGTSMAAPHMAGAAAVMQQYVDEEFAGLSEPEKRELINTLLMNTASPVIEYYIASYIPVPYSVRKQGAGLANVNSAINTKAYVTVDGCERPKAELGDSANGTYSFELTVHNFGDEDLTYNINATSLVSQATFAGEDLLMSESQMVLSAAEMEVVFSEDTITVPAGGEVSVSVELSATEAFKAQYLDYFENGTFLEGYITLESADNGIDLSVPYLGFYGDWGAAPVFDNTIYDDADPYVYGGAALILNAAGSGFYLGMNMLDEEGVIAPDANKIAVSADTVNYGYYPTMNIGLLRAPKILSYTVSNEAGENIDIFSVYFGDGNVYYNGKDVTYQNVIKSFYYSSGGFINSEYGPVYPGYDGWLPVELGEDGYLYYLDGQYYLNATAMVDGTDSAAGIQEFSLPIYIDNELPKLVATRYDELDGEHYITIAITDNHYIAGLQLISSDAMSAYTPAILVDEDEIGEVSVFTFNVTPLIENGIEDACVYIEDYAMNGNISYAFSLTEDTIDPEHIDIVDEVACVKGGESFIVEAYITPEAGFGTEDTITWTSSDERTATVEALDETRYDEETGITYYRARVTTKPRARGQVVITATAQNGASASTIINVGVYGPNVPSDPSDPSDPSGPSEPTVPSKPNDGCDHEWSDWKYEDGMMKRTCSECGITEFVPAEKTEDETNPNTGAPVSNVFGAMVVVAGAAIALKKIRK